MRRSTRSKTRASRRKANRQRLIALAVIAAVTLLLLWLGSYLYDYEIEFYEPRDSERTEEK